MDPFNSEVLHEHVHRYIAQHFSGKDFLTMSEVLTSWNEFAKSKTIENKVRLKLDLNEMNDKDFTIVEKSSRNYKEVSIESNDEACDDALCKLDDSVEKLTVIIKKTLAPKHFKGLKILDLTIMPGQDSWILHSRMDQLEELKLTVNDAEYSHEHNAVLKFLSRLTNLKRLDVSEDMEIRDFLDAPTFRLEHLKAVVSFDTPFLETQQGTLQTVISLGCSSKSDVLKFISKFPKLTTLEVECCSCRWNENEDEEPHINTTITNLSLKFFTFSPEILLTVPALEMFHVDQLSTELMEFIALNMLVLKELSYTEVEEGALERYEKIKTERVERMNAEIQCRKV